MATSYANGGLRLSVEDRVGSQGIQRGNSVMFNRADGGQQVLDLMVEAGFLHGDWRLWLVDAIPCSGNTPRIQVRRPVEDNRARGVYLHLKPGDNRTSVKALLVVEREKNITAQGVYDRLQHALSMRESKTIEAAPVTPPAPPKAVQPVQPEPYHASQGGAAMPSPNGTEVIDKLLEKSNADKIAKLLAIPERRAAIRTQRVDIAKKMEVLQAADARLAREEQELGSIDTDALQLLLDSIK